MTTIVTTAERLEREREREAELIRAFTVTGYKTA